MLAAFAAFIVNECEEDEEGTADCFLDALGALWRLPPRSAFCLAQSRRWKELGVLRPAGRLQAHPTRSTMALAVGATSSLL